MSMHETVNVSGKASTESSVNYLVEHETYIFRAYVPTPSSIQWL